MEIETIVHDHTKTLMKIATEEGNKFRTEHNREPTEAEADRMSKEILRIAKTAVALSR